MKDLNILLFSHIYKTSSGGAEYPLAPSPLERKECTYSAWGTWKVHGHASSILKETHTTVSFHLFTALFLTGCALGYHHATKKSWGNDLCILQFPRHRGGCIVAKVSFWNMLRLGTSVNRNLPCCVVVCTPNFSFGSWLTAKHGGSQQPDRVDVSVY